jgi:glycosyltransferase involved in cell wall biosynthesis
MLTWLAPVVRAKGSAFVPIIHDVYPEIAQVLGKAGAVSGRLFGELEAASLRRSNAVVVLGECQRLVIEQKLGSAKTKVHSIPHWAKREVELGVPQPREGNPWLQQLGIEHKFVIQYSGNMGLFHGVEVLPEAMSLLPADTFHLLLIGEGQKRDWLEAEFLRRGVTHVTFLPHGSDAELVTTSAACDVALVCLHPAALGLCVPSKLYGILAAGRPVCVVAPEQSESAQTVLQYNAGVVVPPGNPAALAQAIRILASNQAARQEHGLAARRCYEAHFTRERAMDAYADVLHCVLAKY